MNLIVDLQYGVSLYTKISDFITSAFKERYSPDCVALSAKRITQLAKSNLNLESIERSNSVVLVKGFTVRRKLGVSVSSSTQLAWRTVYFSRIYLLLYSQ